LKGKKGGKKKKKKVGRKGDKFSNFQTKAKIEFNYLKKL